METIKTIKAMRESVAAARRAGKKIGFVPTMGALHEGHASLVDAARASCGWVAVSIFVNPIQFAPTEDLASYPHPLEKDLELCRARGADVVFVPDVNEMYPPDRPRLTDVSIRELGDALCGRSRPGHFTGVCTVVAKLLNIVGPDKLFLGAKDYQQATILRRMILDLDYPVDAVVCPTVRESDGLAMSSRNAYLSAGERGQAPALHGSLLLAAEMIRKSRPPAEQVVAAMKEFITARAPAGKIDYIQICDSESLRDVPETRGLVLVALAVRFDKARLIDNIVVE
ncbi:MAG: pantoate--beta-alanine ligase [Planctomycetes bacterium]|nr:pantoate--beta-alanine ligase [Planctomycetota bacterium]